jgi:two-component system, NtrC family, response regulator AtoC
MALGMANSTARTDGITRPASKSRKRLRGCAGLTGHTSVASLESCEKSGATPENESTGPSSPQNQADVNSVRSCTPISILAVDDTEEFLYTLQQMLKAEEYEVSTACDGIEAIKMLQNQSYDLILLDVNMPRLDGLGVLKYVKGQYIDSEVIMLTGVDETSTAVECMRLGAYYYVTKPYTSTDLLALIQRALERKQLLGQNRAYRSELSRRAFSFHMVSRNKTFLKMLDLAWRAAPTDSTVLIQGPSGTGKELVANFLHANSRRKEMPFMALNCASIPETLLESELFGHEKGAFTDASTAKEGLVEIANGGTLFLDEIGEMALSVQPKLLRFLQTGEFRRVGGNKNLKSNVRIVSATNKDLLRETNGGRFREDLLYRLNVILLSLGALRERKDDIPLLVDHFLKLRCGAKQQKRLDARALEVLMCYDWPGNIRELENVIERAAILSQDNVITFDDLALPLSTRSFQESTVWNSNGAILAGSAISLGEMQRAHVAAVLKNVRWNKETAAKILGISIKTLYSKIQSFGIVESH